MDVLGVAHVAGKYNFGDGDFLNEGADTLHELGCHVIKVWLTNLPKSYSFNTTWPKFQTLTEMVKSPPFVKFLEKPFTTVILETYVPSRPDHYYLNGMSPDDVERERREIADLTTHLIQTYRETGKTFILQNWEGDWSLRGGAPGSEPKPEAVKGMIDWFNARQAGVDDARKSAVGAKGVRVLHAAEVNHVARAMTNDGVTVTNDVLPHTSCDLYSYSAWDIAIHEPEKFRDALDYLASKAPGGKDKIYVGEYGAPENVVGGADEQDRRVRSAAQTAMDWGAKYAIYWQLYCNEPKAELKDRPKNEEMKGFWMIRPDGSRAPVTDYFIEQWNRT